MKSTNQNTRSIKEKVNELNTIKKEMKNMNTNIDSREKNMKIEKNKKQQTRKESNIKDIHNKYNIKIKKNILKK